MRCAKTIGRTWPAIFGKGAQGILPSGDPVADKNHVQGFLKSYDQMHRFSHGPDGKLFMIVGAENWPMPIPLDKNSAGWYFDTAYGKEELHFPAHRQERAQRDRDIECNRRG